MPLAKLAAIAAVAALAPPVQAASSFPQIDIGKMCSSVSVFGSADKAEGVCRREEAEARTELRALWPRIGAEGRSTCLGDAELGVARSYVDILGCVKIGLELKREKALPADRRVPPQ